MRKIILCEGKTDALMLSYYQINKNNWVLFNKGPKKLSNITNNSSEIFTWYEKGNDLLAIWGVGGNSMFESSIKKINDINSNAISEEERFNQVIILADKDNNSIDSMLSSLSSYCTGIPSISMENNSWVTFTDINSFGLNIQTVIACVIIPFEEDGALETFLLKAMAEDYDKKKIIEQCTPFVDAIVSNEYIINITCFDLKLN